MTWPFSRKPGCLLGVERYRSKEQIESSAGKYQIISAAALARAIYKKHKQNGRKIGNWLANHPIQFLSFAEAYLDSACRLCRILKRSSRKRTYPRSAVILYLAFHSVELFLKAAILNKIPKMILATILMSFQIVTVSSIQNGSGGRGSNLYL